eukprot:6699766-Alexandrium_andersonii.AAC.1
MSRWRNWPLQREEPARTTRARRCTRRAREARGGAGRSVVPGAPPMASIARRSAAPNRVGCEPRCPPRL